jgi:hypothetical protein
MEGNSESEVNAMNQQRTIHENPSGTVQAIGFVQRGL